MLERGMNIEHIKDYESAMKAPWELQHAGNLTEEQNVHIQFKLETIPITKLLKMVGQRFGMSYTEDKRFDWYRGFHVGGKSLMWDDKVIVLAIIILKTMLVMGMGMTGLFAIKTLLLGMIIRSDLLVLVVRLAFTT
jgi:hypothetical protein